ncbi:hypothetical protein DFP73DRAFT_569995 [Morchella snyderi]|nr:hypothetical protein DFP73DRAFT_569995 [Morchella snyderi]
MDPLPPDAASLPEPVFQLTTPIMAAQTLPPSTTPPNLPPSVPEPILKPTTPTVKSQTLPTTTPTVAAEMLPTSASPPPVPPPLLEPVPQSATPTMAAETLAPSASPPPAPPALSEPVAQPTTPTMATETLPPFTAADRQVLEMWRAIWAKTPFQTFKYAARNLYPAGTPYINLPGGNCFDFAQSFAATYPLASPRLLGYERTSPKFKSHGNISFKLTPSSTRVYTVDSGFPQPVRMPDDAAEVLMYRKGIQLQRTHAPPTTTQVVRAGVAASYNDYSVFEHRWDGACGVWTTRYHPGSQTGSMMMEECTSEEVSAMADRNGRQQSTALFLGRKLDNLQGRHVGAWSGHIVLYFKNMKHGAHGDVVFTFSTRPMSTSEPTTRLNVHNQEQDEQIEAAIEKLMRCYIEDGVMDTQWTDEFTNCLDMMLAELRAQPRP